MFPERRGKVLRVSHLRQIEAHSVNKGKTIYRLEVGLGDEVGDWNGG